MRMPAMRVLVNTPAPQGSTGITTNVFPSMTLGCGAVAGNITSDNVGPLHLINIKRLAYVVRTAGRGVRNASGLRQGRVWLNARCRRRRRYRSRGSSLRGGSLPGFARHRGIGACGIDGPAISCGCSTPAPPQSAVQQSVVANVAAEVVDRFLARRGLSLPLPKRLAEIRRLS